MIASIQEELKDKYLKISTTYDNMSKEERKEAFMNYLLSSTHGQKLTTLISQIVACIANEEMYHESELITQELTMYVLYLYHVQHSNCFINVYCIHFMACQEIESEIGECMRSCV